MVTRLLSQHFPVFGYNRSRDKAEALLAAGLTIVSTPREAAENADIVLSMVSNGAALLAVTTGPDGIIAGLSKNKIYIDMSTVSPRLSREISSKVREIGAEMLDAPVSGSILTLEQGKLSIMVGGKAEAFTRALQVLKAIGPEVDHVGGSGMGAAMKICINLNLAAQIVAFAESVVLARKCGLQEKIAVEAVLKSAVASPVLQYRGPFLMSLPRPAWFNVDMMQKDLKLALELAEEMGVALPMTSTANQLLNSARGLGLEQEDYAVVYQVLATLAGVDKAKGQTGETKKARL